MALSNETKQWLDDLHKTGGISDSAFAELKQNLEANSKGDEFVKGSVLRQSDYSRQMGEIDKAKRAVEDSQRTLAEKEQALTKFQGELGTWKTGAEASYDKALKEREAAERRAASAVAKLKTIAASSGVSEEDLLKDLDMAPVNTEDKNKNKNLEGVDLSEFVRKSDVQRATQEATLLDGMVADLKDDHRELFGKSLNATELIKEAIKAQKGVREYWEEKYKVADKRKELDEAAIQKRIADARAEERASILSTIPNAPQPRAGDATDPYSSHKIFSNTKLAESIKKVEPDSEAGGGGVAAAVAAFNQGKYRPGAAGR